MSHLVRLSECRYAAKGPAGPVPILDIPELIIESGERAVLHGPSGSGKTTLLHLLSGLLVPTSGEIEVAGERLDRLSERARDAFRARRLGYVFQSFNLLPGLTAQENVLLAMNFSGGGNDRSIAGAALAEVGLTQRTHHFPDQLSIGEQQRVAVARALVGNPALLLADEPTGSLDEQRSREILEMLEEAVVRHSCALIVVSHDPSVVSRFPRRIPFDSLNRAYRPS